MATRPRLRTIYFDLPHAVATHDWIIEHSGGLAGSKDIGQLESILEHIQNDDYYPEIEDKVTHLVFPSINFTLLMTATNAPPWRLVLIFLRLTVSAT